MILHRDEARPAAHLRDMQRLLELPGPHGGGANVTRLARADNIVERLQRFLDGGFRIPAVDLVQVHVIGSKPLQAFVDLAQDGFARQPAAVRPLAHHAKDLGGDNDLVAFCKVLQGTPEDFLARAQRIDVGRVKEVDPQLQRLLDDRAAVFLVQHPFVDPARCISEAHAAETDARDLHTGRTQTSVFHDFSFMPCFRD